jgi:hypothetical protein
MPQVAQSRPRLSCNERIELIAASNRMDGRNSSLLCDMLREHPMPTAAAQPLRLWR